MTPDQLSQGIIIFLILLISLCIHEWAHAFVADLLGDDTPRSQGRVSLNPLVHADPIGTVILPLFMILFPGGFSIFGWGKPVIVNPNNFRCGKRLGDMLVAVAGPASNIVLGTLVAIAWGFFDKNGMYPRFGELAQLFIQINAVLAAFNLLPIPPLDGFHVARHILRIKYELAMKLSQFGFVLILLLINIPPFRILLNKVILLAALPMQSAYNAMAY